MVSYYFKDNTKKLLSRDKREEICIDICEKFKSWYGDLTKSREETIKILRDIFPGYNDNSNRIKKIPSTYEQFKTYTSAIYRATYQSYEGMIDIEGQDLRSNNISSIYKSSLIYDYNNINLKNTLDSILFDWATKGEYCAYVDWKEEVQQIPVEEEVPVVNPLNGEINYEMVKTTRDVTTFRGVDVKRVDPHNLYYDKTQRHNWQSCGKIYRDFIPIQNILANTSYKLTSSEKKELEDMISNEDTISDLSEQKISSDTRVLGKSVEVLEYYGDYYIPNSGEIVKNAEIVVIAGKFIAKLEASVRPKCPILFDTYLSRPDTDRGQSPMKPAVILNDVENMCIDLTLRSWQLDVDPVFLAPKGAFSTYQRLVPGKPIEYESDILGGQRPEKIDFSRGMRGFDFESFFKNKMEGATGMTQYLLGSQDGSVRTASESSFIHAGATMRVAYEAYLFQNRVILPIVKLHALYKKIYDTENRTVKLLNGTYAEVTKEVREGNYTFIIGSSQNTVEREAEIRKLFDLLQAPAFQSLAQIMDIQTATEFLKWVLNMMNFRGTNQIFQMINMNEQINNLATSMGVRPENVEGFRTNLQSTILNQLPNIANNMVQNQMTQG